MNENINESILKELDELSQTQDLITIADVIRRIPHLRREIIFKCFQELDEQEDSSWTMVLRLHKKISLWELGMCHDDKLPQLKNKE